MNVVVRVDGGAVSLLVDEIGDVQEVLCQQEFDRKTSGQLRTAYDLTHNDTVLMSQS
jgi:hypothetical protein